MNRRGFLVGLSSLAAAAGAGITAVKAKVYLRTGIRPITAIDISHQTGYTISITPAHRDYKMGDIVSIGSLRPIDRYTRQTIDGKRRHFVITQDSAKGFTHLCIYPPIIPPGIDDPHTTVDRCPMRYEQINIVALANEPTVFDGDAYH